MPEVGESDMGLFALSPASIFVIGCQPTRGQVELGARQASAIFSRSSPGSRDRDHRDVSCRRSDGGHWHQHAGGTPDGRAVSPLSLSPDA